MRTWQQRMAAMTLAAALVGGLAVVMAQQKPAPARAPTRAATAEGLLGTAQYQEQVEGKLEQAIATYKKVLAAPDASTSQKARAQLHIGLCYERLGLEEARRAYQTVLEKYAGEQESASAARTRLAAMGQPKPVAAAGPVISQVWKTTEVNYGRVSPDGRYVAGADPETGDLIVKGIASGGVRRLTANPMDSLDQGNEVLWPIWSPDGRLIAYVWSSTAPNQVSTQLRIADVQSGSTHEVKVSIPGESFVRPLDWAPDGKSILASVTVDPGGERIGWVSLDGGFRLLTLSKGGVSSAAVSRNSKWIAFAVSSLSSTAGNAPGIYVAPAAGGSPVTLASGEVADRVAGWGPDDQSLLLVGGRYEALQRLVVLTVANGTPVGGPKTVREVAGLGDLGVSRGGVFLYSSRTPQRIDVYVAPFDMASFTVTGPPKRVNEPADLNNSSPAWSPDGRRLGWRSSDNSSGMDRNVKVRIAAVDEGTTTVIPAPFLSGGRWMNLLWSRDGRFIVGRGSRNAEISVHRIAVSTGEAEVLVPENSPAMAAAEPGQRKPGLLAVSPDGQFIYKTVPSDATPHAVVERRLSDGTEWEIAGNPNWKHVSHLLVSPDGSSLSLRTSAATGPAGGYVFRLEVLPTSGGAGSVVPGTEGAKINFHSWAPDNRTILFTSLPNAATGTPPVEVWRCSIDGGAPAKIGLTMPLLQEAVLSPDGKRIAYTGGQPRSDEGVWMMENFLPPSKPAVKK